MTDVVVLGGGPAGSAAALTLMRRGGLRVHLVEATHYEALRVGESLPPDASRLFATLGVGSAFGAEGHDRCLGSASAWGADELGWNDFLLNPHGAGYHLDRARFDAFLARSAADAGAMLHTGVRYLDSLQSDVGFALRLSSGTLETRFVVDATGPTARFARAQGATRRLVDQLVCFSDTWSPAGDWTRFTLLEAVEYGWWYAARLPNERVVTMLATDAQCAATLHLARAEERFAALANTRHIAPRLRDKGLLASSVHPAPSFVLDPIEGPAWLATGDAASAYDPLSAGGVYKALRDGMAAAERVIERLDGVSAGGYAEGIHQRFQAFLHNRRYLYARERRWPAAPFWVRRAAASSTTSLTL